MENLSWDSHIRTIKSKVSKSIGILCKIRKNLSCSVLRNLYFTLVHPYLDYCNIIWAANKSTCLDKLFLMQKKAIRIVTRSTWNAHTAPLFVKLHVLTLNNVNRYQTGCFMYKIYNNMLPTNLMTLFSKNLTLYNHDTRRKNNFHVIQRRINKRALSIKIYGVTLWNGLSVELKELNSFNLFKTKYKHWLFTT